MAVRKIGLVQELAYHPMKGREIDVAGMS